MTPRTGGDAANLKKKRAEQTKLADAQADKRAETTLAEQIERQKAFRRPAEELKREYLAKLRAERVKIKDDSRFAKYFQMLDSGVPRPAVEE